MQRYHATSVQSSRSRRAGWLALSGSCAARYFPAAATGPPPAISDDSATAAATDISSAIVPRLYFRPGREGAEAAIWEVHALGSALGMGPKARMGEKSCSIVQAGDRHNSADLRRASRFGHFDDLDPAAGSSMWGYINKSWRPPVPSGRAPRAQQRLRHSPSAARR
jgi:hypothetical protein